MGRLRDEAKIIALRSGVFFFYLALAVALTWPVWHADGPRIIGHPDSDIWKHLWGDVWFLQSLGSHWPVPLETASIAYPDGGLLYNLDPLTGIFVTVFSPFLGVVSAHNVMTLLSLSAGGTGAYLLARVMLGDNQAAIVTGAIYAFSAQILGLTLVSGIGETIHIAWLPCALWAALRLMEERHWVWVPVGAASLLLSALGSWYYGLVTGISLLLLIAFYGFGHGWFHWPRLVAKRWTMVSATGQRAILLLFLMIGVSLLLVFPFVQAFSHSISADRALNSAAQAGVGMHDLLPSHNGAVISLADLVIPGEPRLNLVRDLLLFSNHPGFLTLVLVTLAWAFKRRLAIALTLLGLAFLMIGFGPMIHLDRTTPLLPNYVFYIFESVPVFKAARNLERFQLPFTLCVSLAAGFGVSVLFRPLPKSPELRSVFALALSVLAVSDAIFVSGLPFPLPTADASIPALYERMGRESGDFAIIELPLTDRPGGKPFWYQSAHGRPLPVNLEGVLAQSLQSNALMLQLIGEESARVYSKQKVRVQPDLATLDAARAELVGLGFRYVVLSQRPDRRDTQEELRLRDILWEVLGEPVHAELKSGIELYILDPTARRRL